MPRFYLPQLLAINDTLSLPLNIVRHIQVLRLNPPQNIILFNGDGYDYRATLTEVGKRYATSQILERTSNNNESPLFITLTQALSSGERMDFTLQKSVELGVNCIQPIISERSTRLPHERAEKRLQRWQDIVIAACEQSGRAIIPQVLPIKHLTEHLQQLPSDQTHLLMSLNHSQRLNQIPPTKKINLLIGSEGGWSDKEEQAILSAGAQAISLGKRILRTETASLATIAIIQNLWGDF